MEKNDLAFEEASKNIEDYRLYIQSLLSAKKRFELTNIGLLYIDSENSLRFEAKADINFLFDSYGFEPIVANELMIEPEKPVAKPVFESRTAVAEPVIQKQKRSYLKVAALAIGIPAAMTFLLLAAYSKPMQPLMQSSVNPFYTPEKTYKPSHTASHKVYMIDDVVKPALLADANGYAAFTLNKNGTVLIANVNDTIAEADKTLVHKVHLVTAKKAFSGKFQVVLGCFGVKENATKLVNELNKQHINAGISGVNAKGLHVVSCGGFNDKKEAVALLETIRNNYPNAWVLAH